MQDAEVLVVGAGPVGLVLAIDLAQRGVGVRVVERSPTRRVLPKMERCNARTMEMFRRLGFADRVRAASRFTDVPMDVFVTTTLADDALLHLEYPSSVVAIEQSRATNDGSLPVESYQLISQYTLEPLLTEIAREHGVPVDFGTTLESFVQGEDAVTASVTGADGPDTVVAQFLVGCDGGVSTVRKALGIPLSGDGRIARMLQIFYRSDTLFENIPTGRGRHYYTPRGSVVVQDDLRHFMSNFPEPTDGEDPAGLVAEMVGLDEPIEVLAAHSWWHHLLVADRFGEGRVFIAGDAAHMVIPNGGLGMNTGVGDAIDLGWKLTGVLRGWGGPGLLASYEEERRPIALRNRETSRAATEGVQSWRRLCTPAMFEQTPEGEQVRQRVTAAARTGQPVGHNLAGVELGYHYSSSLVVSEGAAPDQPDAATYVPCASPGRRLPDLWLDDDTTVNDGMGRDYTLLRLAEDPRPANGFADAMARRGAPLTVVDRPIPQLRKLYEKDYLLLRPDLHVAWRGDEPPVDDVVDVVTGHTTGAGH